MDHVFAELLGGDDPAAAPEPLPGAAAEPRADAPPAPDAPPPAAGSAGQAPDVISVSRIFDEFATEMGLRRNAG